MITVPIEVSARHAHLTQKHVEYLFGKGHQLTPFHPVSQTGQFSCVETVDLVGNKGIVLQHVRIVGPARPESQVEASITDVIHLHKKPALKVSGRLAGAESIIIRAGRRTVTLPHGLMVTKRHIHCPPARAQKHGLKHLQEVSVRVGGERGLVFHHVVIRISLTYVWSFQIDTDEANAAGLRGGERGEVMI